MDMTVLVLGAGPPPRNLEMPVWLAEQGSELLIERFAKACANLDAKMTFAVRSLDIRRFHIDSVIGLAAPGSVVVPIAGETQGAACTALLCIEHIEPEGELLILNSNEFVDIDYRATLNNFRQRGLDAGLVVFPSLHPRYSYVRLDQSGMIEESAEKRPISRHATAGFYWFRHGSDFVIAAQDMIRKDAHVDGQFYISLVYNELVLRQRRMGVVEIEARHYHPLKSRPQIAAYEGEPIE